ncbi:hypothetical protein V8C37DRAFT_75791 [Trichoderma ceciliae]
MGVDLTSFNVGNGTVDDDMGSSPATSIQDPSTDMDDDGNHKFDFRWCCKRWHKLNGTFKNYRKHLQKHNPQLSCEAEPRFCFRRFTTNKERNKHYRTTHPDWAVKKGIPDTGCSCEACGTKFRRGDFRTRHLRRFSECQEKIEKMLLSK